MSLYITIGEPLWFGGENYVTLPYAVENYQHTIAVDGGYKSCSFSFGASKDEAERWAYSNMGGHIQVFSADSGKVWEGFIDEISIDLGSVRITRGPLTDMANYVMTKFQTPSYSFPAGGITIGGEQSDTGWDSDSDSIIKYGRREKMLSAGTASGTEAAQLNLTFLAENKEPKLRKEINTGNNSSGVDVRCKGYYALLDYFPEDTSGNGTVNLSTKLQTVLAANPDSIFSTNYDYITSNVTQVERYFEVDQTAESMIKAMVSLGDSAYQRYIWGIYDDLIMYYEAIPIGFSYLYQMADPHQAIYSLQPQTEVPPYAVRPGKWLFITDFLTGVQNPPFEASPPSDLREDPRMLFIESVSYNAPDTIRLEGGQGNTLEQKLNRLGLGNM